MGGTFFCGVRFGCESNLTLFHTCAVEFAKFGNAHPRGFEMRFVSSPVCMSEWRRKRAATSLPTQTLRTCRCSEIFSRKSAPVHCRRFPNLRRATLRSMVGCWWASENCPPRIALYTNCCADAQDSRSRCHGSSTPCCASSAHVTIIPVAIQLYSTDPVKILKIEPNRAKGMASTGFPNRAELGWAGASQILCGTTLNVLGWAAALAVTLM